MKIATQKLAHRNLALSGLGSLIALSLVGCSSQNAASNVVAPPAAMGATGAPPVRPRPPGVPADRPRFPGEPQKR